MFFSLLALCVCAGAPLEATRPIVDRGEVRIGPPLVDTFTLTNRGTNSITITDVRGTCGCLAPTLDRRELKVGESANLKVEVNTLSQPAGSIGWPVRVIYSVGETQNTLELALRAKLISEVQVEPAAVAFQVRQPRSVTVTITDTRAKPFHVTAVGTTLPQLRAEIVPGDGTVTQVRLTATPDGRAGTRNAFAWIATDDPLYPQIKVPVTLTVLPTQRVAASPHVAPMCVGETKTILLRDRDGQQVSVDRVECDGPIQVTTIAGPGLLGTLKLTVDPNWNNSPWSGTIKVHLRGPIVETITIPADLR